MSLYDRKYYIKNREKLLARKRKWYHAQGKSKKQATYKRDRLKTYGITISDYNRILDSQHGRCAICDAVPNGKDLHVDHCHETGQVRGLLCLTCNAGIGLLKDRPDLCYNASVYLAPKFQIKAA